MFPELDQDQLQKNASGMTAMRMNQSKTLGADVELRNALQQEIGPATVFVGNGKARAHINEAREAKKQKRAKKNPPNPFYLPNIKQPAMNSRFYRNGLVAGTAAPPPSPPLAHAPQAASFVSPPAAAACPPSGAATDGGRLKRLRKSLVNSPCFKEAGHKKAYKFLSSTKLEDREETDTFVDDTMQMSTQEAKQKLLDFME